MARVVCPAPPGSVLDRGRLTRGVDTVLPAAQRVRLPAEFRHVVRRGHRAGGRLLVVHAVRAEPAIGPLRSSRVGFVVPRSVGGAVVRNTVRRRLRHLVRPLLVDLPAGSALVVRVLPAAATAAPAELATALIGGVARACGAPAPQVERGTR